MKKLLLSIVLSLFLSVFSSAFADKKIYNIGGTLCLVADDQNYDIGKGSSDCSGVKGVVNPIYGFSKTSPICFNFFMCLGDRAFTQRFFHSFSLIYNTIFFNVEVTENLPYKSMWQGEFLNNFQAGYFQLYCIQHQKEWFALFSIIDDVDLEEQKRNFLFKSVQALITPIYSHKSLEATSHKVEVDVRL